MKNFKNGNIATNAEEILRGKLTAVLKVVDTTCPNNINEMLDWEFAKYVEEHLTFDQIIQCAL